MKESMNNDQAEQLRTDVTTTRESLPFNTSSLPSRKEVHGKKKQKVKLKIKFPLVKLLALFFVLLPITVLAIYTYLSKDNPAEVVDSQNASYSEVKGFESYDKENNELAVTETEQQEEEEAEESKEATAEKQQESVQTEQIAKEETAEETKKEENVVTTETTTATTTEQKTETKEEPKVIEHTVKANETIFRIAMTYFSSQEGIEIIKQYNGLSSNEIHVGQVLKIPVNQ